MPDSARSDANSAHAWDNLSIEGSSKNDWIDHCEFWDGQDGNADVVKGADNVTFTWNIFDYRKGGGHNFFNLVASSDDEPVSQNKLNITLMFNWFSGVAQRQPRCRYADIYVVNNLFSRDGQESDYGISAGKDGRILTKPITSLASTAPSTQATRVVARLTTCAAETSSKARAVTPPATERRSTRSTSTSACSSQRLR